MSKCELCGEPMPEGEEMFKIHGYSGGCPKPPIKTPHSIEAVIEYVHREVDGKFWIMIRADRIECNSIGPFDTAAERQRAHDDLIKMMCSLGAKDLPRHPQ